MERSYEIYNLDCAHCGAKIEEAINELEEVESAVLNFPLKKLKVNAEHSDELLEKMNRTARAIEPDVEIRHYLGSKTFEFEVRELDCAHCGAKIEQAVGEMYGIESAVLNFPLKKLTVTGNVTDETIELMNELARSIEPGVELVKIEQTTHSHSHGHEHDESLKGEFIFLGVGIVLFIIALLLGSGEHTISSLMLYIAAYIALGWEVLRATWKNILSKNFFDENTLMTIATIGAFALGEYSEAVGVMLFFKVGELFEDIAVSRSRRAITDVAQLRVDKADVLRDGSYVTVSSDEIKIGDILRIKAGERIAADGTIESGSPFIDTSAVTGEPLPVQLFAGDSVMSGCINTSETFTMKASAAAGDSMISRIARAVEDASAEKPKIDRFITRFSKVYTPIVIAAAVLTAVLGTLITGDWSKWVYSALTFLVISCPCALVLSVPLAYFSGIGAASKLGILFKGGESLEALGKVRAAAFDKTGTLTTGTFGVTRIVRYSDMTDDELLELCAACEQSSTHPVAKSIVSACGGRELAQPERVTELAGRGISAVIGGREVLCGNAVLMSEKGISLPEADNEPGTKVYIAAGGTLCGMINVSDTYREGAAEAVSGLKSLGAKVAMFTGDSPENAEYCGRQLGIPDIHGGLLPEDKLRELEAMREKYGAVMFVGDGINDGPVLAGADVGAAMQTGSDLALEAADVVFMNSDPVSVVRAKRIADKTLRIAYENIIFALAVKAAVLVLGILGFPNMWFAVFADSGTAMLSILNSIRVLRTKQYR
ncbi:MAG: cadmium-translocating P-type ATPase [Ruminococcus sp.]|nr:cadmium-translocating P-type ATPase [Ruminococcus sp.]